MRWNRILFLIFVVMIHHFSLMASADDLLLSGILVEPDTVRPQGIVQFVHGMCYHKER